MQNNYSELEKNISYTFKNKKLLEQSFIHPSYANEHKLTKTETNQRLEFLGDSVLELVISTRLFLDLKDREEGALTKQRAKIVCEENLSKIAIKLNLYNYLLTGKSENKDSVKNNKSIMCDTIESLIGAIYLDSGIEHATEFINKFIYSDFQKIDIIDYKSFLKEYCNKNKYKIDYEIVEEIGPDHNKLFNVALLINNEIKTYAIGHSKKEAETIASKNYLETNNIEVV